MCTMARRITRLSEATIQVSPPSIATIKAASDKGNHITKKAAIAHVIIFIITNSRYADIKHTESTRKIFFSTGASNTPIPTIPTTAIIKLEIALGSTNPITAFFAIK